MVNIPIKVCVIALTQNEVDDLEPEQFKNLIAQAADYFDFAKSGKPYAASADDWNPFGSRTIVECLKGAGLEPTFLSSDLYHVHNKFEVMDKTNLYIIDPLVLMHRTKRQLLIGDVQATIRQALRSGDCAYCIILPANVPVDVRRALESACNEYLIGLYTVRLERDWAEWEVEKVPRFEAFLHRVYRQFSQRPISKNFEAALKLFSAAGIAVDLKELPRMT